MENGFGLGFNYLNFERRVRKISIGDNEKMPTAATLGNGSYITECVVEGGSYYCHLLVGRYCSLSHKLKFTIGMDHDYKNVTTYPFGVLNETKNDKIKTLERGQVIIGNDVWIGRGVTVVGQNIVIGNGAVIGAGAVVAKDVPPYAIVVGNPARVIKYRFDEETIKKLQAIKWWYRPDEVIQENLELMNDPKLFVERFQPLKREPAALKFAEKIKAFKAGKTTVYAFVADFGVVAPLWLDVFEQYLTNFSKSDNTLLIFATENQDDYDKYIGDVERIINAVGEDCPSILLLRDVSDFIPEFVEAADYVITTREDISSQLVDYAQDYGVKIISGLSYRIFS